MKEGETERDEGEGRSENYSNRVRWGEGERHKEGEGGRERENGEVEFPRREGVDQSQAFFPFI